MMSKYGRTLILIWKINVEMLFEAAGTEDRRVNVFQSIGSTEQNDTLDVNESIRQLQETVDDVGLIIGVFPTGSTPANPVEFVNEENGALAPPCLRERRPHRFQHIP